MPTAVTARSLSSLNDLANAPPSNLPLQLQDEEPLILYIARVPGSRGKSLYRPSETNLTLTGCFSYADEAKGEGCQCT